MEVVLSLKVTGQHVSVPIRVLTHSLRAGGVPESGGASSEYGENSDHILTSEGFWVNLSWLHLFLLILLTILLLLACKFISLLIMTHGCST